MSLATRKGLLEMAADDYGYDSVNDMLMDASFDSVVPAICTKCGATQNMEPDQNAGWCDECQKNTVVSVLVLAGLI